MAESSTPPPRSTGDGEGSAKTDDDSGRCDHDGSGISGSDNWQELMGRDLMMKVVGKAAASSSSFDAAGDADAGNGDATGDGGGEGEGDDDDDDNDKNARIHDAVTLDVTGHRIASMPPDEDECGDPGGYVLDSSSSSSDGEPQPQPFLKADDVMIALGEGDVCNGIEMAARFLERGEVGLIRCKSKYAYGPGGRRKVGGSAGGQKKGGVEYDLPPNSDVLFTVTLKSIVPAESPEYGTDAFRIARAKAKKDLGNDAYKHEWSGRDGGLGKNRALRLYKKAGESMSELVNELRVRGADMRTAAAVIDPAVEREALALMIDCLNNVSAVHMRAKDYGKAKDAAANAIRQDPNNMKALLRAARAAMLDPAGTYEESDMAIRAAEEINSADKEVHKMRAELTRKKQDYKKREKAMYGKMLGGASGKQ